MFFLEKFKKSKIMEGVLYGIRPAAIGLIAAVALTIGREIIIKPDLTYASFFGGLFSEPLSVFSPACLIIFLAALLCLWKVKVNPIIVTLAAGIAGAILVR
jgi:chromate transporter